MADWDLVAVAAVGDFPLEPLELAREGEDWYLEELELVFLAPVLEHDPARG